MSTIAGQRFDALLESLAAKTPTPGGGAAASAVGAVSAALAGMVVAYSIGKKDLASFDPELRHAQSYLANARTLFLELTDEDAAAYGLINELSRLPESDPRRRDDLPGAFEAGVRVPQAVLAAACDLLRLYERLAAITNKRLRSDLAIAAVLAESAARSSLWNVLINAPSLADIARREAAEREARVGVADAEARRARIERACAP